MLRPNLWKRRFVTTADELLRRPILDRSRADPDTLQDLDSFPVPLLPGQLSEALRKEFNEPITTATDWSLFPGAERAAEQSRGDWYRAARLIHETLASKRNCATEPTLTGFFPPTREPRDPVAVRQWILAECEALHRELQTGTTERFEDPEQIISADVLSKMTPEQRKLAQPALNAVVKAARLHPDVKKEILTHICTIIMRST